MRRSPGAGRLRGLDSLELKKYVRARAYSTARFEETNGAKIGLPYESLQGVYTGPGQHSSRGPRGGGDQRALHRDHLDGDGLGAAARVGAARSEFRGLLRVQHLGPGSFSFVDGRLSSSLKRVELGDVSDDETTTKVVSVFGATSRSTW